MQRRPAPWTIDPGPYGTLWLRDGAGQGFAQMPAVSRETRDRGARLDERAADALMLQALPDLVAALRGMVIAGEAAGWDVEPENVTTLDNARAVLARVESQS